MRDKMGGAIDTARPYVERLAKDEELHDHIRKAYEAARSVYEQTVTPAGPTAVAMRVAKDKDLQDELRKAIEELREAGKRARGKESHTGRNMMLLLAGVALGVLFNPVTGPESRKWVKEKLFGPEEPFEFQTSSTNQSS